MSILSILTPLGERSGSIRTAFSSGSSARIPRSLLDAESPPPAPRRGRFRASGLGGPLLIALLALGPAFAWASHDLSARYHRFATEAVFADTLAERTREVDTHLLELAETLYALRGLFDASDEVTREEFATFTKEARQRHPTIIAILWIPRVVAAEGDGRDRYPVRYVEPFAANAALVDYDLRSDLQRWPVLEAASNRLGPAVSAPLTLLTRREGGIGAALALAIRAHGAPADSRPIGFVGLTFEFADVLAHLRSAAPEAWSRLSLSWADVPDHEGARLVVPPPSDPPSSIVHTHELRFAGRTYSLGAMPAQTFLAEHRDRRSWLLAVFVFAVWEVLALVLYVLARAWRSGALTRQARTARLVLESLSEGVVMADGERRVQVANDAALRLLGTDLVDIRSDRWIERCPLAPAVATTTPATGDAVPLARAVRGDAIGETEMRVASGPAAGALVAVSARPMFDASGALTGGVMVLRDVTTERRSEAAAREADVEMRLAAKVQQHLYPRASPAWPGLDVAGAVVPAVATAGDYYDFLDLPCGSHLLVVGDVAGHGLGPALVMAETRASLRAATEAGVGIDEVLARLNRRLADDLLPGMFVSLLLVEIDPSHRVWYANAGHTPALLFAPRGEVKLSLSPTGPALGVHRDAVYRRTRGPEIATGDVLVLMTDGVTESPDGDGEMFEDEGVASVVRGRLGQNARAILEGIQHAVAKATDSRPRRDDLTLVVCKATVA